MLGILGAGVQARAHIQALTHVRKIERIKVYSPSGASAAAIKKDLEPAMKSPSKLPAAPRTPCATPTCSLPRSTSREPIIKCAWLKTGVHINAVGSHRPDDREIDGATVARAKVVVDSREAIMAECGDILLAIKEKSISENHIHGEIGEVLAGTKTGRSSASEITLYKSVGIAIQDVATANLIYRKALERGVGTNVEI